jgi:hypothetical protein
MAGDAHVVIARIFNSPVLGAAAAAAVLTTLFGL